MEFLIEHSPFENPKELRNIITGEAATHEVNCYMARELGQQIMENMYGQNATEVSFRKKDEVRITGMKQTLTIEGESVKVDPQLLFQRLISIMQQRAEIEDISQLLKYELATHPSALFDENGLMREATKAQLSEALAAFAINCIPSDSEYHVIDGGLLLHIIPWKKRWS